MVAYMNRESLRRTQETGQAWFWSRERGELWHKGATSGNYMNVKEIRLDCDGDALLLLVEPAGPACHTGKRSCFFYKLADKDDSAEEDERLVPLDAAILQEVFEVILERQRTKPEGSYVAKLLNSGTEAIARKIGEEATETIIAALTESPASLTAEIADLWFHSLILLASRGQMPGDVWRELAQRRGKRREPH